MTTPTRTYPHLPSKLILTSTKAYFPPSRTLSYLTSLLDPSNGILPPQNPDLLFALIPDFLTIYPCTQSLASQFGTSPSSWPLSLGAQDCFWETQPGAYTGEIIPSSLAALGVSIVELGHAERRRMLSETNETTAKKARAACECGMVPLVCIGEISAPSSSGPMSAAIGSAMRELQPQIESVLAAVPSDAPVILAYEPVWAIGAAQPASVDYVGPVVQAVREIVQGVNARGRTGQTKVVYGGSAGPGLWSGKTNGGNGLGQWVDGMFLGRFAHEISGVKAVMDEVVESMKT